MEHSKDSFSRMHPIINFLYFGFVFAFSMIFMHPVFLGISLICSLTYSVYLRGRKAVKFSVLYMLPMLVITALINPAFNHEGLTILAYLDSGNPLTLESIVYGFATAVMFITVISWFICYNAVMTSDKFVYLFGRVIPALSLILSMVLRFVPKFKDHLKIVSNAQKCVGRDPSQGNLIRRVKNAIKILSIMVTWALENAIETADSMKSRGYGLLGRTAFSIYRFDKRDKRVLAFIASFGMAIILCAVFGGAKYRYFPTVRYNLDSPLTWISTICYLALCLTPIIINGMEDRKWKATKSAA